MIDFCCALSLSLHSLCLVRSCRYYVRQADLLAEVPLGNLTTASENFRFIWEVLTDDVKTHSSAVQAVASTYCTCVCTIAAWGSATRPGTPSPCG